MQRGRGDANPSGSKLPACLIGSWEGCASHAISIRLSPLTIECCLDPRLSLEKWWQEEKCLAVWTDDA